MEALVVAAAVFGLSYGGLLGIEKLIHKLTRNPDQSYRWGVWTFAILAAMYAYTTALGRM